MDPQIAETQIIKDFLTDDITIDNAVQKLTSKIATSFADEGTMECGLWEMWASVNEVARETPCDSPTQDKLVQLIDAIKHLPPLMHGSEQCRVWGIRVWNDLPIFGANIREDWNWFDPPESDPDRAEKRQKWCNLNAFVARLTATRTANFDLYALWGLREALEEEIEGPLLDAQVVAAAQWILYAGHIIYNSDKEWKHGPTIGDPARGGKLWQGKRGFCRERWALWKNRFAVAAQAPELQENTRNVVERIVEAMTKIEEDPQADFWRPRLATAPSE